MSTSDERNPQDSEQNPPVPPAPSQWSQSGYTPPTDSHATAASSAWGQSGYAAPTQPSSQYDGSYAGSPYTNNYAQGTPGKGLAIAALSVGIITFLINLVPFFGLFFSFLGLVAIGLGIAGLVTSRKSNYKRGVIFSIIGIVLPVVGFIIGLIFSIGIVASSDPSTVRTSVCDDRVFAQEYPEICDASYSSSTWDV